MAAISDIFPAITIGATFTAFGLAKVYGLAKGIEGGGRAPLNRRLCGS